MDRLRLRHAQEPVESLTRGRDSWRLSAVRRLAVTLSGRAWEPKFRATMPSISPWRLMDLRIPIIPVIRCLFPSLVGIESVIVQLLIQTLSGNSQHLRG